MNVLFVHTRPLPSSAGGAELTLSRLIADRPAGVAVTAVTPDSEHALEDFDAVVIAGLRPEGGPGEEEEAHFAEIWSRKLGGYAGWSMASEHDVQPCAMRDARCVQADPLCRLGCRCGRRIPRAFQRLYRACSEVRFLSPGHRRVIGTIVPLPSETVVIAPPIDFGRFQAQIPWKDRLDRALAFADPIRHGPDAEAIAAKKGLEMDVLPYGSVAYEDMPALLNRYRHVVMAPQTYHAFGRLAAEAMACGCKVWSNGRVGALTWPDPLEAARQGSREFWRLVVERRRKPRGFTSRLMGLLRG